MHSREALARLRNRCATLGIACTPIQDRSDDSAVVDVTDPDGTVLRFYWVEQSDEPDGFRAIIFEGDEPPRFATEPRLQILGG